MKITVELMPEDAVALRKLMYELSPLPIEEAAAFAINRFLVEKGYMEPRREIDEDTETVGEA